MKVFWNRHKKKLFAVTVCFTFALIACNLLYLWLWNFPREMEIDLTLQAEKMEGLDNAVGTIQISIKGKYYDYLWQDDKYELSVAPFDCYEDIQEKEIAYFADSKRGCASFSAYNKKQECRESIYLHFTDALDRLIIQCRGKTYYVGSVSGEYTNQECISYYQGALGDEDYVVYYPFDLDVEMVKMNSKGEELGTVPMHIEGFYKENLFSKDNLCLVIDNFEQYLQMKTEEKAAYRIAKAENGKNVGYFVVGALKKTDDPEDSIVLGSFMFYFTEEMDRFFMLSEERVFYYGSASGKYTGREVKEYFDQLGTITYPNA